MRNTEEYPITTEEIVERLDDVIASLNYGLKMSSSPIGDMRPLLLALEPMGGKCYIPH